MNAWDGVLTCRLPAVIGIVLLMRFSMLTQHTNQLQKIYDVRTSCDILMFFFLGLSPHPQLFCNFTITCVGCLFEFHCLGLYLNRLTYLSRELCCRLKSITATAAKTDCSRR